MGIFCEILSLEGDPREVIHRVETCPSLKYFRDWRTTWRLKDCFGFFDGLGVDPFLYDLHEDLELVPRHQLIHGAGIYLNAALKLAELAGIPELDSIRSETNQIIESNRVSTRNVETLSLSPDNVEMIAPPVTPKLQEMAEIVVNEFDRSHFPSGPRVILIGPGRSKTDPLYAKYFLDLLHKKWGMSAQLVIVQDSVDNLLRTYIHPHEGVNLMF